ncbi:MAG TPA: hypothetical protein VE992_03895 [Solirubrobacteraceae bacterium]|nr:hypothetical protein [Solirubrobacteraceae bacterium]
MRKLLPATLIALALAAAPAAAQPFPLTSIALLFGDPQGFQTLRTTDLPVRVTGGITVTFAGSAAAGCAARGVCGYHGTLLYDPAGGGDITIQSYVSAGRRHRAVALEPAPLDARGRSAYTWTEVQRDIAGGSAGECADEQASGGAEARMPHGAAIIALADLLSPTRCAGPLPSDLADALPELVLNASELAHGRRTVDLHSVRRFAGGGFAGTVTSTLVLALRTPRKLDFQVPGPRPRYRLVTEAVKIIAASGAVTERFQGSSDQGVCVLLDSCGAAGTLTLAPSPLGATGLISAIGPARRPLRDFLTALGLARGGRVRGIAVSGDVVWNAGGTVSERFSQTGSCLDHATLGQGILVLGLTRTRLSAVLAAAPPRARCPGPVAPLAGGIAAGTVPRAELGAARITVTLNGGPSLDDDGYTISTSGRVSLTLRRGRAVARIFTGPRF